MRIKKLHIKDYKRFHDLTIDLGEAPKRIIALVGPNGCGKSSIFDAILFLAMQYGPRIGDATVSPYNKYHMPFGIGNVNRNNVDIEFLDGSYQHIRDKLLPNGRPGTIFSFRSSFRYNSDLKVCQIKAMNDIALNNYGASSASTWDQKMEQNYRRLYGKLNKYMEQTDSRPSEAKQHIIGELNSAISHCLELEIASLGNVEADEGTLYFKKQDKDALFEFNVLSAGEKEVVDLLLDLYLRQEVYNNTVFLIDEPELHINTSIQRKLLVEMNKMIGANCQLWIATHSIGFLRALQDELADEAMIIEFKEGNQWASESYVLTPSKKCYNMWKSLFSTALDDLANLICPKRIIYCEGRAEPGQNNEERGLDAKVYNTIFAEKYPDTLFISSGGNTELDQRSEIALSILSKVFNGIEIWVLKDRDMASGKMTNEHIRQEYLRNNAESHRVLRRFEIENYLFDKEVICAYSQANNLEFDENSYDEFVNDIFNQNLKDSTTRIKNITGIASPINPEVFKANLANYITQTMTVYKELEHVIFERR